MMNKIYLTLDIDQVDLAEENNAKCDEEVKKWYIDNTNITKTVISKIADFILIDEDKAEEYLPILIINLKILPLNSSASEIRNDFY